MFLYTLNFKSFVTLNFYLNQSEISELFCVNKEKPQLNCNGKCHLNTVLTETATDDETPFSQNNSEDNLDLIFDLFTESPINFINNESKNSCSQHALTILNRYLEIPCPPPKV